MLTMATLYYHINIISLFNFVGHMSSLRLVDLQVPQLVLAGANPELSCRWQLDPGELLYSVKWYKDGNEFFRYIPKDVEPRKFVLPGVTIEAFESSGSKIVLSNVELTSSGRYRCEVSGERPFFFTVSEYRDMVVIVPPQNGPTISGFLSEYGVGEKVEVNCKCGPSHPPVHLAWYINGEPTDNMKNFHYAEGEMCTSRIALNFSIEWKHFTKKSLKIKCLATIPPVYWKSNEEGALQRSITGQMINKKTSKSEYIRGDSSKILTNFKILITNIVIFISIR